jgi:hypothetical protein
MAPCGLLLWRIFGPLCDLDPAKLQLGSRGSLRLELGLGVSAAGAEAWDGGDGFLSSFGKPRFSRRPPCIELLASRPCRKQWPLDVGVVAL